MASPIPSHIPSIRDLRAAAQQLKRALAAGDTTARRHFVAIWPGGEPPVLLRCLHVIAREQGAGDWESLIASRQSAAAPSAEEHHAIIDLAIAGFRERRADLVALLPAANQAVLAIVSQTGGGKSFLAKRILLAHLVDPASAPVVLVDPWDNHGFSTGDGLEAVARHLGRTMRRGARLEAPAALQVLTPASRGDAIPELIAAIARGAIAHGTVVYVDGIGHVPGDLRLLALACRDAGCPLILTAQLVSDVGALVTWTAGSVRLFVGPGLVNSSGGLAHPPAAEPRLRRGQFMRTTIDVGKQVPTWEPVVLPQVTPVERWLLTENADDLRLIEEILEQGHGRLGYFSAAGIAAMMHPNDQPKRGLQDRTR